MPGFHLEVDEQGRILDGHTRAAIAKKHGLEYETIVRKFDSEAQKRTHVIKLNLCRRQMTDHYWGKMFKQLCLAKGVRLGSGKGNPQAKKSKAVTVTALASELGVSESTARRRVKAADELEIYGDAIRDDGKRPVNVKTDNWHGRM